MNILVAFNDGYAIPTKVMLTSLICNNPENIDIYVMYCSLSDESVKTLSELNSDRVKMHFQQLDSDSYDFFLDISYYSKEAFIRLFAHEYLDDSVDRILWLDGDIIIKGSLKEFYNQSFEEKCYVAVKDMNAYNSPDFQGRVGLKQEELYINSGVLLMNIPLIKKQIDTGKVLEYIKGNIKDLLCVDQDVFNGFLYDKIKVLCTDRQYNCFTSGIDVLKGKATLKDVIILHYSSNVKPWKLKYRFGAFRLWWKYYRKISDTTFDSDSLRIHCSHLFWRGVHYFKLLFPRFSKRIAQVLHKSK